MLTIVVQTRVTKLHGKSRSHLLAAALVAAVALLASASVQAQTTWYVDDDAPTDPGPGDPSVSDPLEDGSADHPFDAIQEGIDAATGGDTVLVLDGTYTGDGNRDLDFGGKPIAVRSENGPESCIIDCEGELDDPHRGFHFHGAEGPDSVVEGLTITNGYARHSHTDNVGGGIRCEGGSPTICNCTISENSATYGGGVYCRLGDLRLANCTINGNRGGCGGGIVCDYNSNLTLTNCKISENWADYRGGGVYCAGSSPTLTNCTINGNTAESGGGVYCFFSGPLLTNCAIAENSADFGGGIYCINDSSPNLTNCTISGNAAYINGGGVDCDDNSSPTLTNCILWGDTPQEIRVSSGGPTVTYCDIQGGWIGEGNIDTDPLFAFPDDFHLMPGSPCIDTGTEDPPGGLPANDLDGNERPLDGDGDAVAIADMGAYEFNSAAPSIALSPANCRFVAPEGGDDPADQTLSLRNCGGGMLNWEITGQAEWLTVWPSQGESTGEVNQVTLSADISGLPNGVYTAVLQVADPQSVNSPRQLIVMLSLTGTLYVPGEYPTIQAAIDAAVNGDVVELADGTYAGAGNRDLDFAGKAIAVRSENGPECCIIDCEGDPNNLHRGFHFHSREGPDSIVEGLTITNGYLYAHGRGGGVYCYRSSPTIISCTISGNLADRGGGVCCEDSSPTLANCTIGRNSASGYLSLGGGVFCANSSPTLTNCEITGNDAGGVCCYSNSSPTLTNCTISGNSIHGSVGGGVSCNYSSSPTLTNCSISGNSADRGGGVFCRNSNPTITNCTISGNSAIHGGGGGVHCQDSSATITNCILWGDAPQEICDFYGGAVVTYCNVQGGWTGEGNIDADPLFLDPDGPDDDPNTWEDNDYRLSTGSPCIDAADNMAVPFDLLDLDGDGDTEERTPFDLDGNPRFVQDPFSEDTGVPDPPRYRYVVDMGAYEYQFCFGDLDQDDDIDTADLIQLLGSYGETAGMTYYDGDLDGDGDVDLADLAELLGHYGESC